MSAISPILTPRPASDCEAYNCPPENWAEVAALLAARYPMLMDISAVDLGATAAKRFEAVYHFFDPTAHAYLRIAVACADATAPKLPSVASLWPSADWHEREAFDLMGIVFVGHPNLKRIMMWEAYPAHPLRKDFPLAGIQTDLPGEDVAEETGVAVGIAPLAGGPFTAGAGATASEREPRGADQSWTEGGRK